MRIIEPFYHGTAEALFLLMHVLYSLVATRFCLEVLNHLQHLLTFKASLRQQLHTERHTRKPRPLYSVSWLRIHAHKDTASALQYAVFCLQQCTETSLYVSRTSTSSSDQLLILLSSHILERNSDPDAQFDLRQYPSQIGQSSRPSIAGSQQLQLLGDDNS